MKTQLLPRTLSWLGVCLLSAAFGLPVLAQGTAFTYQGRLGNGGASASGLYDLTFAVFSVPSGPGQVGSTLTASATPVTNGLFTVTLDFGPGLFAGVARWLEIGVRTNGGSSFTTLAPRQELTPVPYAIFANTSSNLTGSLPTSQLSGTVGNNQLANNSVTVNAGTGLSGGGTVALGGALTLNNAGVLSVAGNPDITVSTVGGAVTLGDTATDADSPGLIVKRDPAGNFSAGTLSLNGNLIIYPVAGNNGIIYFNGATLMSAPGIANFFAGPAAGNLAVTGFDNTADGATALAANIGGSFNTASGSRALMSNTSGSDNNATGAASLQNNTVGNDNTADGYAALFSNSSGNNNTAAGSLALSSNISGNHNTAEGAQALRYNTVGNENTAAGYQALYENSSGNYNTAVGTYALLFNTNGAYNTAEGYEALNDNTSGNYNTALGSLALYFNTSGSYNTANGGFALYFNTTGRANTANGYEALYSNTLGTDNTAIGVGALFANTNGAYNTAAGASALASNTSGTNNTAVGAEALFDNTSGSQNTAEGASALAFNTVGTNNTASGYLALYENTSGSQNTAVGAIALANNTTGTNNTANGVYALQYNNTGSGNLADGALALQLNTSGGQNTAVGSYALGSNGTGSNNIALGFQAGQNLFSGSGNIEIGNPGTGTDAYTIRIGSSQTQTFLAGVFGVTSSGGSAVYVNSLGQLGTASDVENVALLAASQTFSGANTFNGTVALENTVQVGSSMFMNDHDIQFRGDLLHGIGWYGAGKLFAGLNVNGPALYGNSGGVLGSKGASTNAALLWDATGRVNVDPLGVNTGNLLPGITFGLGPSGEGIASQRSGTGVNGLDFYTGNTLRLRIVNGGFVGIGTNNPQQALHVVGNIVATGTVTGSSDRNAKERFVSVNPREVLEKVSELPISRWNYKNESEVTHLGPMAQDFYAAFAVGQDDKHISMVDADGVALAAIQGLNQKLTEELKRRDAENAELKQRLETLEKLANLGHGDSK